MKAELRVFGSEVHSHTVDLNHKEQIHRLWHNLDARRTNVLVNNAGVIALTRALAKESVGHGFRVNTRLPGGIGTSSTQCAAKQALSLDVGYGKTDIEFLQRLSAGQFGQPDKVARMALARASDLASYMHGAAVSVDGGFLWA